MKNKNNLYIVTVGIIVLAVLGIMFISKQRTGMMNGSTMEQVMDSRVDTGSTEYKMYSQLTGDEYDRQFIANMIEHHQGAIDMAKLAQTSASHSELKTLASNIISSQSSEIKDMTSWQAKYGYAASSGEMMMDHSSMGMAYEMGNMTEELKSLSGNAFDLKFLELMIGHHQSAIDMAQPGIKNAKHQEVKDLARAIVDAQSKEIAQMKQWQKDWRSN